MKKILYVAYGSNLNKQQMKARCRDAKLYATGTINDYELQFKGMPNGSYATIAPKKGGSVPVAVWEISQRDELMLDRYEGYPSHYFKRDIPVQTDAGEINAMVYIMNLRMGFGLPSPRYYLTVYNGYRDCGLDIDVLENAVINSTQKYYSSAVRRDEQQSFFDAESDDEPFDEEYEDEKYEEDDEEIDDDPFYFFSNI